MRSQLNTSTCKSLAKDDFETRVDKYHLGRETRSRADPQGHPEEEKSGKETKKKHVA